MELGISPIVTSGLIMQVIELCCQLFHMSCIHVSD